MAKIFITGSADGLGQLAATELISQGHQVVLHARNEERGRQALAKVPGAAKVLIADLSSMEETKNLAAEVNAMDSFDVVIHNAGVYEAAGKMIFAVNTLASYMLTSLIQKPKRLIYLSSGSHLHGNAEISDDINDYSYSDSKLHILMLSMAAARKWPGIYANAVNPGWVPTKMGGPGAPDNLDKGVETQVWLAVSNEDKAKVSGCYFYHKRQESYRPEAKDAGLQDKFLLQCEKISGIRFPTH